MKKHSIYLKQLIPYWKDISLIAIKELNLSEGKITILSMRLGICCWNHQSWIIKWKKTGRKKKERCNQKFNVENDDTNIEATTTMPITTNLNGGSYTFNANSMLLLISMIVLHALNKFWKKYSICLKTINSLLKRLWYR